ncbi:MAG TPA: hypothetical protein DD417_19645 [Elusimicrobia bacterium]|nr:hypothetical protein [Elusimicrobiota bacterium]
MVGDACRSCGEPFVANASFRRSIEERDTAARVRAGCVRACEACGRGGKVPVCSEGRCALSPAPASAELPDCHPPDPWAVSLWARVPPAGLTDAELAARLVYAEALATGCSGEAFLPKIVRGIAWVVASRVRASEKSPAAARRFGKGVRGVVFQPGQFDSTLSTRYSLSRWKDFLCPRDAKVWALARDAVRAGFAPGAAGPFAGRSATGVYYYRHFDPWPAAKRPPVPAWAAPDRQNRLRFPGAEDPALDACIGFFSPH